MNINDGDGCSKNCELEKGWTCNPSCTVRCGDGYVVAG